MLALQAAAGNRALARMLTDRAEGSVGTADAFRRGASGAGTEVPLRGRMESAFGASFADVRVHLGGDDAVSSLHALGARAATRGNEIIFRDALPTPGLIAHELAHVLQQRRGASGVQRRAEGATRPDLSAERAAERAAAAVVRGEPVPEVGVAATDDVQLAPVSTAGGDWETTTYAVVDSGGVLGADINLKFTPKDPIVADTIGLTQSVRTMKSGTANSVPGTPSFVGPRNQSLSLGAGTSDPGRAIDQGDSGDADTIPNTNPLYAVENTPGHVSASLGDVGAAPGMAHGHRRRKPDGTFDVGSANIADGPRRGAEFAGQQWSQTFEVTALVLDGPFANMYLGSVEWGWMTLPPPVGRALLYPDPIRVVREGPPTAAFMDAAKVWNAASFTDPASGNALGTVHLPIEAVDPGALSTADLGKRLEGARKEATALPAGDPKARKDFEVLALQRELEKRNVKIAVKVKETEDIIGSDDVYVELMGKSKHTTPTKKLNNGDSHEFLVPLTALAPTLPLVDPVQIEVYDADWPDADDLIVKMAWSTPYGPATNTSSMDDADYDVTVSYER